MTLVLSFICHGIGVQVADRLVCEWNGQTLKALDAVANKLLVYRSRDAIVSIGYAGQAFIGDLPTDEWITQFISGVPMDRKPEGMGGIRMGGIVNNWDIGQTMRRLRDELPRHVSPGLVLQLAIIGHQANRKNLVRPLAYDLEFAGGQVTKFYQAPRAWPLGRGAIISNGVEIGDGERDRILTHIRNAQPALTHDQIAEFLTEWIRANGHPGVGPHTSAVILPFPGTAPVRTRFFPFEPHHALIRNPRIERAVEVHYAPWIIGGGAVKPPTAEVGGSLYGLGGIEVAVEAPAPASGVLSATTTVPRFELPARLRRGSAPSDLLNTSSGIGFRYGP